MITRRLIKGRWVVVIPDLVETDLSPYKVLPHYGKECKHEASMEDVIERFVTNDHRKRIWDNYLLWQREVDSCVKAVKLWIGGSFLTSKPDPHDIDIVVWVDPIYQDDLPKMEFQSPLISLRTNQWLDQDADGKETVFRWQPGNDRVDGFFAIDGMKKFEDGWTFSWGTIFDERREAIGEKGFLEVRL